MKENEPFLFILISHTLLAKAFHNWKQYSWLSRKEFIPKSNTYHPEFPVKPQRPICVTCHPKLKEPGEKLSYTADHSSRKPTAETTLLGSRDARTWHLNLIAKLPRRDKCLQHPALEKNGPSSKQLCLPSFSFHYVNPGEPQPHLEPKLHGSVGSTVPARPVSEVHSGTLRER